ncbi:MAG TPA: penicillin-binding transpeptidase domain-containing protein [Clostridia bacterium]|nr:penicillin-binding transpeptidase domain-containing protein [Clostridia bacterium]
MAVKSQRRRLFLRCATVLSLLVFAGFGASAASLVRVQFVNGEEYRAKAELRQLLDESIPAKRGTIYDANGKVLAESASVWKIYINPKKIAQFDNEGMRAELINKLSDILNIDEETVREATYKENTEYWEVKKKVEFDEKEKIVSLREEAYQNPADEKEKAIPYKYVVGIRTDEKRYYPYGTLASAVIGFCGVEGGSYGLEKSCDDLLKGTPGRMVTVKNAGNDAIPYQLENTHGAKNGANLVLTIDQHIQHYLEDGLTEVYNKSKAVGAYGIVMDVQTGAILAMAGKPDYDLNSPETLTNQELAAEIAKTEKPEDQKAMYKNAIDKQWLNYCTQWTYEPGSVFKPIVAAAAVEEKMWLPSETYNCTGKIPIMDRTFPCHARSGHGFLNLSQAVAKSCNTFFVALGQRLGIDMFRQYFEAFGFMEKTGIELNEAKTAAGETYHATKKFGTVQLASSSFGQSFEVTPLQMITATAAIANGGRLMQPYIVARQLDDAGNIISSTQPYVRRQVVSATTAAAVTEMMELVVTGGSGKNAYVPGYRVAGKTGTSQKLKKPGFYVGSFACFAPADDAKIAVLILVDEPQGEVGGSRIAAPIAREVVDNTLKYLNVEPKYSQSELMLLNTKAPKLIGKSLADAKEAAESEGLAFKVIGSGDKVTAQNPAFNQGLPKNGIVILYTDKDYQMTKTTVPDFSNKSVDDVYAMAITAGLNIKVTGNISSPSELVSYKQNIEKDTRVICGSEVIVSFQSNAVSSEIG